jgi:hypothetical protein
VKVVADVGGCSYMPRSAKDGGQRPEARRGCGTGAFSSYSRRSRHPDFGSLAYRPVREYTFFVFSPCVVIRYAALAD